MRRDALGGVPGQLTLPEPRFDSGHLADQKETAGGRFCCNTRSWRAYFYHQKSRDRTLLRPANP